MGPPHRLFILAGEASGDRLGADLVRRLRQSCELTLSGVGGGELIEQGLRPLFPIGELSVMGLADVVVRLPRLLWRIADVARHIRRENPDVVLLIDQQVFSRLLAKRLRASGWHKPILLYGAPTVWARHPERAAMIRPLYDEILAVLPFEPRVMRELGGPMTSYVGHPALADPVLPHTSSGDRIALLPGSRAGELRRHMPLLRTVAESHPDRRYFMPMLPDLAEKLRSETAEWSVDVEIVAERSARPALFAETAAAVCAAGTATLELALHGVPMVVMHVMDRAQAIYYERLRRPTVGLPSIILGERVAPEAIMAAADPSRVADALETLLWDTGAGERQRQAYRRLRTLMSEGVEDAPRQDPAERVLRHLAARPS